MKEDTTQKWIVCLGEFQSDSTVYTMTHIVRRFHQNNHHVLWVNAIPNRGIFSGGKSSYSKKALKRYMTKIKVALTPLKKKEKGFYIFTPFFLPWLENKKIIRFNDFIIKLQLRSVFAILGIRNFILSSSSMMNTPYFFKNRKFKSYFHYVGDLYSDYRNATAFIKEKMFKRENEIFNFADKIFIASKRVFDKIDQRVSDKNKLVYFPHGVEFNHFHTKSNAKPAAFSSIQKPIVGYFGSLTDVNDKEAIVELANNGFSVVLIGKVSGDYSECEKNPNVHFLGPIPYKELPAYGQAFDICMLNWEMAEWIKNSNPQKTYEYLAMGKPIVSCRIPEAEYQLGDLIYFADSPQEYPVQARKALEEDSLEKQAIRTDRARQQDWDNKFSFINKHLI